MKKEGFDACDELSGCFVEGILDFLFPGDGILMVFRDEEGRRTKRLGDFFGVCKGETGYDGQ